MINDVHLQYFSRSEFKNANGDWWHLMSPRLLVLMDVLRFRLDAPIYISASDSALGRHQRKDKESEHNVNHWSLVLAADSFVHGVYTYDHASNVVGEAINIGFTGVGVYADTFNNVGERQVMFHFGVRPTRRMGDPATWGRVNGEYCSLIDAMKQLP